MIKRLNFKVTYKGTIYRRAVDFAQAVNLDTRLVLSRYRNGWRDPEKLAQPPIKKHKYVGPHKVEYRGITYNALTEFARAFNLSYAKLTRNWEQGKRDPEYLIEASQPRSKKESTQDLLTQKQLDEAAKEEILRSKGLLTIAQLSSAVGIDESTILFTISNLIRTDSRRQKSEVSIIGLHRSDIVRLNDNDETIDKISNKIVVPKYGIRPVAISHIKFKQNYLNEQNLIRIPKFEGYYFDVKNKRVWSKKKSGYKELKPSIKKNGSIIYNLKSNEIKYGFTIGNLEDYILHPEIKYEDILSFKELVEITKTTKSWWGNHGINRIFPDYHVRFKFDGTNKKKRGLIKAELINALKTNPETEKFVPLIKK